MHVGVGVTCLQLDQNSLKDYLYFYCFKCIKAVKLRLLGVLTVLNSIRRIKLENMDAKSVDYENQNQSKKEKYMIKAQKLFKFESKS